jgi:hypothetical protein
MNQSNAGIVTPRVKRRSIEEAETRERRLESSVMALLAGSEVYLDSEG